ncbi:MAG: ABC transporter ATP-binding protein [Saccharofermentanales bacterium]|nr:ABC transporter ATP-binding protein [Clostridiaceae bacterium]
MSIRIEKISKAYGELKVIDDLTVQFPPNGLVGLSGPSGCGKTTLLRLLAGLEQPDRGLIKGIEQRTISMVFQEDRLLPWLSAVDNVAAVLSSKRGKALNWLERVYLSEFAEYYPAQLSGGMKRRVALARALARPGDLLLLDEPFTGMDIDLKKKLFSLLQEAAIRRLVVLVTHDLADIGALAGQAYRAEGPPLRLREV